MKELLFRTGSGTFPVQSPTLPGSQWLHVSIAPHDSTSGVKYSMSSLKTSLQMKLTTLQIRRCSSESDVIQSESKVLSKIGLRPTIATTPQVIEEEDCNLECRRGSSVDGSASKISLEELGFFGGGPNKNYSSGGRGGGGGYWNNDGDSFQIGVYYQELLQSDPTNSLILGNYAKYLHEVERNVVKAEEYYSRAILASPGDGEVLSLYGKLIWEANRDENRAKSYFDQALHASPDDCSVLGSYAHFMWEAEEDEEEVDISEIDELGSSAAMLETF